MHQKKGLSIVPKFMLCQVKNNGHNSAQWNHCPIVDYRAAVLLCIIASYKHLLHKPIHVFFFWILCNWHLRIFPNRLWITYQPIVISITINECEVLQVHSSPDISLWANTQWIKTWRLTKYLWWAVTVKKMLSSFLLPSIHRPNFFMSLWMHWEVCLVTIPLLATL